MELLLKFVLKFPFFYSRARLEQANQDRTDFNENTHKSTAFDNVIDNCLRTNSYEDNGEKILSAPQVIELPFQCEDEILDWEVQYYPSWDLHGEFYKQDSEGQYVVNKQLYFGVMAVELVSVEKKKWHTKGKARRFTFSV